RSTVGWVVLLQRLAIDLREPRLVERGEELPSDLERLLDRPVFLGSLSNELLLEPVGEFEHLAVAVRERFLSDDGDEAADVLPFCVRGIELVRHLLVVLAGPVLADPRIHESRQGWKRVHRRVYPLAVQGAGDPDLAFRDLPGPVRHRVGPIGVRGRPDPDLGYAGLPSTAATGPRRHSCS